MLSPNAVSDQYHVTPRKSSLASPSLPHINSHESNASNIPTIEEDEALLKILCACERGFELLSERIKQSTNSSKEVVTFLKKKAQIEEDYGKHMIKLAQSSIPHLTNGKNDGKEGSYLKAFTEFVKLHEQTGQIRLNYAEKLNNVAEELKSLSFDTERSRKQLKEAGAKNLRIVNEADSLLEKAKNRYDLTSEEWEKAILVKDSFIENNSHTNAMLSTSTSERNLSSKKNKVMGMLTNDGQGLSKSVSSPINLWKHASGKDKLTLAKVQRNEEESKTKAYMANDLYKQTLQRTNSIRNEYYGKHLPDLIRHLKDTNDDCDLGLLANLQKSVQLYESSLTSESSLISSPTSTVPTMQSTLDLINNGSDFHNYIKPLLPSQPTTKKEYEYAPYNMSVAAFTLANPKPVFKVDLTEVLDRDGGDVPILVKKCIDAIESEAFKGLSTDGVYRISGISTDVQKLKNAFDKDAEAVVLEELTSDVNSITSLLKLYFRELPNPLFTSENYASFIEATRLESETEKLVKIHELVNDLPDAHYGCLRKLMGHLYNVSLNEPRNKMTCKNLSIIWGPTLLKQPGNYSGTGNFSAQSSVVEIVLNHFNDIF